MAVKEYFIRIFRKNTSVGTWSNWKAVKHNASSIKEMVKGVGSADQDNAYVASSFEEAVKHYGMSEADLRKRMKNHLVTAIVCAILGLFAFGWMINLVFFNGMLLSGLVALGLSSLMLAYAFREHFFYFKIKQRRLNCTVREWFLSFMPGRGAK